MAFDGNTTGTQSYLESGMDQVRGQTRSQIQSQGGNYRQMPTKNLKFEKFVELMFQSGMDALQIQTEVVKYVQALETNYTETIKDLKMLVEKERNRKRKSVAENVNSVQNRNEMETLFVSCIEEVRKDIMKRRLKNEIYNRKKFQ